MVYGKCQEAITHFSPREGGGLVIGELMLAGAGAGAVTSFVLYVGDFILFSSPYPIVRPNPKDYLLIH
jgi:hypothetical protein